MWYYCFRLHFCKNYFLKNSNKFLFTLLIVMLIYRNIDSEIVFMEVISSIIFCALSSLACTNFLTSKLKIKWVDMPDGFLAFYRIKILLQQFYFIYRYLVVMWLAVRNVHRSSHLFDWMILEFQKRNVTSICNHVKCAYCAQLSLVKFQASMNLFKVSCSNSAIVCSYL